MALRQAIGRRARVVQHAAGDQQAASSPALASSTRATLAVAAALAMLAVVGTAQARDPMRATNSRAARQEATEAIPRQHLSSEALAKVDSVMDKVTLFRRLPVQVFATDPDLYQFMVTHPEIIANVWQLLGIDDVVLTPTGPGKYQADDAGETAGCVEYLHQSHDTLLVYAEGTYDGPMFAKPVAGSCVLLLRSEFQRESDGRYYVTSRLDAFLRLDHLGAEVLAKTFQPLVSRVADMSFMQTAGFVESLSRAAESNPRGMFRLAARLSEVAPTTRAQFVEVTARVAQRESIRQASAVEPLGVPSTRREEFGGATARGQLR